MPELFLFADEAGDFTFNREPNVSRYFIICTVTATSLDVGDALRGLRHQLVWEGAEVGDCFHATSDAQSVRDRVFDTILQHEFQVQATICEKAKAQPQVRESKARFYKYPFGTIPARHHPLPPALGGEGLARRDHDDGHRENDRGGDDTESETGH